MELEELQTNEFNGELQWKERARWIKFEEDVEKNERWGKPHVASLSFQSLLELRRGIERGIRFSYDTINTVMEIDLCKLETMLKYISMTVICSLSF